MGFGEDGFGGVPFGSSPEEATSPRVVPQFQAYDIDVQSRDVPLDDNGFYQSIHAVDHRVRYNIMNKLGAIPTDKSAGSTLSNTPFDTDEVMTADGDRRVRAALKQLIDTNDIKILAIKVVGGPPSALGRIAFELEYMNLRLPESQQLRRESFQSA